MIKVEQLYTLPPLKVTAALVRVEDRNAAGEGQEILIVLE